MTNDTQGWSTTAFAVYGAIFSTYSAVLATWLALRDRRRKVKIVIDHDEKQFTPPPDDDVIRVSVTNWGREISLYGGMIETKGEVDIELRPGNLHGWATFEFPMELKHDKYSSGCFFPVQLARLWRSKMEDRVVTFRLLLTDAREKDHKSNWVKFDMAKYR